MQITHNSNSEPWLGEAGRWCFKRRLYFWTIGILMWCDDNNVDMAHWLSRKQKHGTSFLKGWWLLYLRYSIDYYHHNVELWPFLLNNLFCCSFYKNIWLKTPLWTLLTLSYERQQDRNVIYGIKRTHNLKWLQHTVEILYLLTMALFVFWGIGKEGLLSEIS